MTFDDQKTEQHFTEDERMGAMLDALEAYVQVLIRRECRDLNDPMAEVDAIKARALDAADPALFNMPQLREPLMTQIAEGAKRIMFRDPA